MKNSHNKEIKENWVKFLINKQGQVEYRFDANQEPIRGIMEKAIQYLLYQD